ncbi:inner-membrane translocator [Streptomyces sp. NPDC088794]|uniref:inner-membrane translocator n=1 Tax=Streptomyces sp. NPDC088794 TaxID=3365902 RepID=UPI00380FF9AD
MSPPAEPEISGRADAALGGCLLLLVLMADAMGACLAVIVMAMHGLGQGDGGAGRRTVEPAPTDWTPVWCWSTLAPATGVTGVLLLRIGHRVTGTVQLTLCVILTGTIVSAWP